MYDTKWSSGPIFRGLIKQPFLGVFLKGSENGHFGRFCSVLLKCDALNQTIEPTLSASARPKPKVQTTLRFFGFYIWSLSNIYYGRGGGAPGTCPHQPPKSVSCARFGHVLYVIQHQFMSHNKRLIMTSGRRGNGGSKTRLQNGCFWRTEKWGFFGRGFLRRSECDDIG